MIEMLDGPIHSGCAIGHPSKERSSLGAELDERRGLEILLDATDRSLVDFQLDIGWVAVAGQDRACWIRRLGSRLASLHFKECTLEVPANIDLRFEYAPIESGAIDWNGLLRALDPAVLPASSVEIERQTGDAQRGLAKRDLAALNRTARSR